jgi:hypothetical protein
LVDYILNFTVLNQLPNRLIFKNTLMKNSYTCPKHFCLLLVLLAAAFNSCVAQSNEPVTVNEKNAFKVETRQVGQCTQQVPVGWQTQTNKEGNAMDLWDPNGTMYAGYGIFPVNTALAFFYDKELYNKDPQRSVIRMTSMIVGAQFKDGPAHYTDEINQEINGYQLRSFASNNYKGVVLYKIFPGDRINFTYIECVRFAITRADLWEQKGELVAGIAASISCNTMLVQHEMPSIPRSPSMKPSASKSKKDDYGYNPQLGTEYCHNPRTGENFRVSPSTHWSETGPDGPGYYGMAGNERIKMAPGRSN